MYLTVIGKRKDSGQPVRFAQSDQSVSVSLIKFIRAGNLKVKAKVCDRTAQPNYAFGGKCPIRVTFEYSYSVCSVL